MGFSSALVLSIGALIGVAAIGWVAYTKVDPRGAAKVKAAAQQQAERVAVSSGLKKEEKPKGLFAKFKAAVGGKKGK